MLETKTILAGSDPVSQIFGTSWTVYPDPLMQVNDCKPWFQIQGTPNLLTMLIVLFFASTNRVGR